MRIPNWSTTSSRPCVLKTVWITLLHFVIALHKFADSVDFSFSCPGIGFFGDSSDCRVYYICTGTGKIGMPEKCGEGTAWNQERKACQWLRNLPPDTCKQKSEKDEPPTTRMAVTVRPDVEIFDPAIYATSRAPPRTTSNRPSIGITSKLTTRRFSDLDLSRDENRQFQEKLVRNVAAALEKLKILLSLFLILFL